ncbi:streptavidin-like [Mya arenaria]|nr:streptavidin-like [Mya arenaria]
MLSMCRRNQRSPNTDIDRMRNDKMMSLLTCSIVLSILTITSAFPDQTNPFDLCDTPIPDDKNDCGIAGVWRNQLQSVMKFTCVAGHIEGQYYTAVGNADGFYDFAGKFQMPDQNTTVLGWVVAFNNLLYGNSNSTTAWSGIHYGHEGIIHTHWLLTHYFPRANLWRTTTMNHDDFNKVC